MAARVNSTQVKAIIDTSVDDVSDWINTANVIVEAHLLGTGQSDAVLSKVELYLAAHFVALTEERGGLIRSSAEEAAETYADIYGKGFQSTRYGQQAISIDASGKLAALGVANLKAQIRVV